VDENPATQKETHFSTSLLLPQKNLTRMKKENSIFLHRTRENEGYFSFNFMCPFFKLHDRESDERKEGEHNVFLRTDDADDDDDDGS
jgi:hypothetical protein